MWVEYSKVPPIEYGKKMSTPESYPIAKINGIPKFTKVQLKQIEKWGQVRRISKEKFGISLSGIKVRKDEIVIDPEMLKSDVFYLFSYKNERYVARKTNNNIIEIYEVIE